MSWSDARDAIVAIPATVTPSVVGAGLPALFRYDKAGHDNTQGAQSRRWWGRVLSGVADGPATHTITRHRVNFEVVVEYIDSPGNTELIDKAIPTDAQQLAIAFGSGANWNRPTSGIVAISALSNAVAPFTVEQLDGCRRLRFVLEVRYQS